MNPGLGKAALSKEGKQVAFAGYFQLAGIRSDLDGIHGLARKAVCRTEDLPNEVKLLDGRNDDDRNAAAFEKAFARNAAF